MSDPYARSAMSSGRQTGRRHVARTLLSTVGAMVTCLALATSTLGASPPTESPAPAASAGMTLGDTATPDPTRLLPAAAGRLADLVGPLEADRALLLELRKDLPTTRAEAESYLAHVEQLALTSDPERLGVIVSRLRAAAPIYLDWRDQQFATPQEASTAYLESGAAAFDATRSSLQDAILLTVANRIDTIIEFVDAIRGGQ